MTTQPDAADSTIRIAYDEWADTYDSDRNLTRDLDQQVMQRLLSGRRFGSVVEIGCGTGKNTALLARIADRVHAIDFAPQMIRRARELPGLGNVAFTIADVTRPWPCPKGSADLVTCNLVLEHVADLGHIVREARCALADGGRLFVCELHPFRQYQGKQAGFVRDGCTHLVPAFVHHLSDFTGAAAANGFRLESLEEWWHEDDDRGISPPRLVSLVFASAAPSKSR